MVGHRLLSVEGVLDVRLLDLRLTKFHSAWRRLSLDECFYALLEVETFLLAISIFGNVVRLGVLLSLLLTLNVKPTLFED